MDTIKYIPALRFKWLTPLYDFFLGITMPEGKIKRRLIDIASINADSTLLDFGCGTEGGIKDFIKAVSLQVFDEVTITMY